MSNTGQSESVLERLSPEPPQIRFCMAESDQIHLPEGLYDSSTTGKPGSAFENIIPLVVAEQSAGQFVIIDGCKRFQRNRMSGISCHPCSVIGNDTDEKSLGLLRMTLNRGRTRTLRETVLFVRWLMKNYMDGDFRTIALDAGISAKDLHGGEKLAQCPDSVVELVAGNIIHMQSLEYFLVLSSEEQSRFCGVFEGLGLSSQTQREILEWLPEISYTDKTTVLSVLDSPEIKKVISDKKLNSPQKIEHLHRILFTRRFPRYSADLSAWNHTAAQVNPDSSSVHFSHAPAFEKKGCEIRIHIHDGPHAIHVMKSLANVPRESWEQLANPAK